MHIKYEIFEDHDHTFKAKSDESEGIGGYYAKVVADSRTMTGTRLTTFEVRFPRYILPEFNTHRVFSRNSASSRAIPATKTIAQVGKAPVVPLEFGVNQPGMQASDILRDVDMERAVGTWLAGGLVTMQVAEMLVDKGIHKQVVNRVLEPFLWHTVIVSATDFDNFLVQRDSPLAQPEIELVAKLMSTALEASAPQEVLYGAWHLPYILEDEWQILLSDLIKISAARCARVSYLTHDGIRNVNKDIDLWTKLITADPPHWSPLEHVAVSVRGFVPGNFDYEWAQVRGFIEPLPPRQYLKFSVLNPPWLMLKEGFDELDDVDEALRLLVVHPWMQ